MKVNDIIKGLGNVGLVSNSFLLKNLSSKDYLNLINNNFIESIPIVKNIINDSHVYRLSDKGKALLNKLCPDKIIYHASLLNTNHDIKLSNYYWNNTNDLEKNSWLTEKEIKNKWGDQKYFGIDACYINSNGDLVSVESIGSTYTNKDISNKRSYAKNIMKSKIHIEF